MKYLIRVLGLPFFLGLMIIWLIRIIVVRSYDWVVYGGEATAYNKLVNNKTILDVFNEIKKEA